MLIDDVRLMIEEAGYCAPLGLGPLRSSTQGVALGWLVPGLWPLRGDADGVGFVEAQDGAGRYGGCGFGVEDFFAV